MSEVLKLINEVGKTRKHILEFVKNLSPEQTEYKPSYEKWSIKEILEHLYWSEYKGINYLWKAAVGYKRGILYWYGESYNEGLTIENIVSNSRKIVDQPRDYTVPQIGGPVNFWISSLSSCQQILEDLGTELKELDLEKVVYPHVQYGPLNAKQRLEYIRFHLERHLEQIKDVTKNPDYPKELSTFYYSNEVVALFALGEAFFTTTCL